jgi:hypothetical protein
VIGERDDGRANAEDHAWVDLAMRVCGGVRALQSAVR